MISVTEQTGRDLWLARVAATPRRDFLHCMGRTWTFAEFDEEVQRLAGGLQSAGVGPQTRVLVILANRPEAIQIQLALHMLGAVVVPLLPTLTLSELTYPINHCAAEFLIADGEAASAILTNLASFEHLQTVILTDDVELPGESGVGIERFGALAASTPLASTQFGAHQDRVLGAILYTSGSTGRPKGVMIAAGSFYSVGEAFVDRFGIGEADNFILPTPFGHAVGALTALSMTLHTGGSLAMVDRFSPSRFWSDVESSRATYSVLFPAHLNLLLEADDGGLKTGESTLRLVITHNYARRFQKRFGIELATVWGMTETGALSVGSEPGYGGEFGSNYVGTPMLGVEVDVYDERLSRCVPGQPGEIALRHKHVMLGYLNDPETTARTMFDGWVRSGDQGVIDQQGRLFFVGRIKNVIKRSGENVSAEEVELALLEHPDVSECTVFAVPDPIRTEEVAAAVVPRAGSTPDPPALIAIAAETLVRWKLPRYIFLRDEALPRLGNGKLDLNALRASIDVDAAWDATNHPVASPET
jgi:crotonobetaine/carnitine-CoA ligase